MKLTILFVSAATGTYLTLFTAMFFNDAIDVGMGLPSVSPVEHVRNYAMAIALVASCEGLLSIVSIVVAYAFGWIR